MAKYTKVPLVIGKIPGYNRNINSPSKDSIFPDYTERLKNNLTTVSMVPTGYLINYAGLGNTFLKITGTEKIIKGSDISTSAMENINDLYLIGPKQELSISKNAGYTGFVSTGNALENWKTLVEHTAGKIFKDDKEVNELRILCTNDSSMTEVFSNSFGISTSEELANMAGSIPFAQKFQKFSKAPAMLSSAGGLEMLSLGSKMTNNQLLNLIEGKALGIQTALPKEWKSSNYSNSLQLMIKLVSPSGHENDIQNFILKPLTFLIMAGSPISSDGINFGYPTIWEIEADGMMDMRLGAISAMTITRGGNETQFNRYNQPLNIDVRLTIEPLIDKFAVINNKNIPMNKMMVNNPYYLDKSFNIDKDSYKTIKL